MYSQKEYNYRVKMYTSEDNPSETTVTSEQMKTPFCTEKGERTYTAVFTVDGAFA